MIELQNRLDAEFLPAQMCSVKFKEWIASHLWFSSVP
ncbi:unnamed protein product [Brassica rapa]|uniref:Uncharacterized protein n=1 Tax=Brassica campestris TaxID=3711 RepID=A0A8D9HQ77_BRACM|nr:unnamed protein product [Brassica rapa]